MALYLALLNVSRFSIPPSSQLDRGKPFPQFISLLNMAVTGLSHSSLSLRKSPCFFSCLIHMRNKSMYFVISTPPAVVKINKSQNINKFRFKSCIVHWPVSLTVLVPFSMGLKNIIVAVKAYTGLSARKIVIGQNWRKGSC